MTLVRRLSFSLVPLALSAVVLSCAAVAGLWSMSAQVARARQVTEELREAYEVAQRLVQARTVLAQGGDGAAEKADVMLLAADRALAEPSCGLPADLVLAVRGQVTQTRAAHGEAPINQALNRLNVAIRDLRREAAALDESAAGLRHRGEWFLPAVALVTVGAAAAAGFALYMAVAGPVRRMRRGVDELAGGALERRLPEGPAAGDAELAALAAAINRMAAQLEEMQKGLENKVRTQAGELARAERLASVGFLAAGVAHEINNPLAIIAAEAELAARGGDCEKKQALEVIREEAFRCRAITARLLETARGAGVRARLDLRQEAQSVVALARRLEQAKDRQLRLEVGAPAFILADAGPLRQVILNLVVNALEAAPAGTGEVVVTVAPSGVAASLCVRDNGAGIAPADLLKIFEPFFTTKQSPATPGLGLGLSIAQAIVAGQGGRLAAHSDGAGQGARFTAEWPLAKEESGV